MQPPPAPVKRTPVQVSPMPQRSPSVPPVTRDVEMADARIAPSRAASISTEYSVRTQSTRTIARDAAPQPPLSDFHDFVRLFSQAIELQVEIDQAQLEKDGYSRYEASSAVKDARGARKVVESPRKELERKLQKRTAQLESLVTRVANSATINMASSDVVSKLDAVLDYCTSIRNFVEDTKPVISKIEALAVKPPPVEDNSTATEPAPEKHLSPAATALYARTNNFDVHLDEMETNFELRAIEEPIKAKVYRIIDSMKKSGAPKPSVEEILEQLQHTDRIQGDELTRQAELIGDVIVAQKQQKHEYDTMLSQLNEAQAGLAEARSAVDAQAAQIEKLAEQYREAHEHINQAAIPVIDTEKLFEEVVKQATTAITTYTSSIRKNLEERDRIVAGHVWQAMEPARQLIVGVCGSVFP
ncbi:hypothetical protein HWV62_35889 [Athelia sp. TMB]|nr:hypothetical protein HWV62_35889 [Athelia sp. TMB]